MKHSFLATNVPGHSRRRGDNSPVRVSLGGAKLLARARKRSTDRITTSRVLEGARRVRNPLVSRRDSRELVRNQVVFCQVHFQMLIGASGDRRNGGPAIRRHCKKRDGLSCPVNRIRSLDGSRRRSFLPIDLFLRMFGDAENLHLNRALAGAIEFRKDDRLPAPERELAIANRKR